MKGNLREYQEKVKQALSTYEELRETLKLHKGQTETINTLARPFVNGYFTIAVIGKMSAGKSAFINALLGNRNLLATGFGQTTSTLTEIVHSDTISYKVVFADGSIKDYKDIEDLKEHIAIQEDYVDIPIKQVNELIIKGNDFDEIWEKKAFLEQKSGKKLDGGPLKEYVDKHPIGNIPKKVIVSTPFPQAFHGWKIVDTPGIAATGGIEDETFDYLSKKDETGYNNNTDAIIFVNSAASQIEDRTFKDFVEGTIKSLPEHVKERMFLVRTHGADRDYLRNRAQQSKEAHKLFVEGLGIKENRLIVVDSLCAILNKYADDEQIDLTGIGKEVPSGWDEKQWDAADDIVLYAKKDRDHPTQETIKLILSEWSNFDHLKEVLNNFAKSEKETTFKKIIDLIQEDLNKAIEQRKKNISLISENMGDSEGLKKRLEEEESKLNSCKNNLNSSLNKLRQEYGRKGIGEIFLGIRSELNELSGSIDVIEQQVRKLFSEVEGKGASLLLDLASDFKKIYNKELKEREVVMPNIDFTAIATEANRQATHEVVIGYEQIILKKKGFIQGILRALGIGGYKKVKDKNRPIMGLETDQEEEVSKFKNMVITLFNSGLTGFQESLGKEVDRIGNSVMCTLNEEIKNQTKEYEKIRIENQILEAQENTKKQLSEEVDKLEKAKKNITTI